MFLETDLNREPCPVGERLKSGSCQNGGYPFFVAHAVRARGSDGHQKSVNYSQVVRELMGGTTEPIVTPSPR